MAHWTNKALYEKHKNNAWAWESSTIKMLLLTSAFPLDIRQSVEVIGDIAAYEMAASGYSRHTMGGKSVVLDNANNQVLFKSTDVITYTITGAWAFRYAALYVDTGVAGTSYVLAILDKGSVQSGTSSDIVISQANNIWLSSANQ